MFALGVPDVSGLIGVLAAVAGVEAGALPLDLTRHWAGFAALLTFAVAYLLVASEEKLHLRKSMPVVLAAGVIWSLVALVYARAGDAGVAASAVRAAIADFGEIFLFLLVAMTYVNTMEERNIFDALRGWLIRRRLTLRAAFWVTGVISFFLSGMIDNMTTALVMGTVAIAVGRGNPRFVSLACVNVVVAANAGGAFTPFGDITTLMVWQAGILPFFEFFRLFVPALVNWFVPAALISLAVPTGRPATEAGNVQVRPGGFHVVGLFAATVALTVTMHNSLGLPPVLGMMTGLGLLYFYAYRARWRNARNGNGPRPLDALGVEPQRDELDIFRILQRAEWDTLMFFYGVILSVAGLSAIGYLSGLSALLYTGLGATTGNILVGIISSVIDNIPVMFSVIEMRPAMSDAQWLLVTLTTGVGGSLLSVGSAAGVALMGQARGTYTFLSHLRWTWAIALGYAAAVWVHLLLSGA